MSEPYSANPLADMVAARDPLRFEAVSRVSQPPKMFGGGTADVPAFTASGVDPQHLLKLPAGMRHAAAENPDINQVFRWFEMHAGDPDATVDSPGLQEAQSRMESWIRDTDTRTPEEIAQQQAQDEAEYEAYRRSQDQDGLLPGERAAQRAAEWQAKQDALAKATQQHLDAASAKNRAMAARYGNL